MVGVLVVGIALAVTSACRRTEKPGSSSAGQRAVLSVRVAQARRGTIRSWVFGEGTARAVRREYLTFQQEGKVTFVRAGSGGGDLREGERVSEGELLAQVDPKSFEAEVSAQKAAVAAARDRETAARAVLEQAVARKELVDAEHRRNQHFLKQKTIAKSDFEVSESQVKNATAQIRADKSQISAAQSEVATALARLSQAELNLDRTRIHAPFTGIVAYLNTKRGYFFTADSIDGSSEERLLRSVPIVMIDPSQYEITLEVPAFNSDRLRPGLPALLMLGDEEPPSQDRQGSAAVPGQELPLQIRARGLVFSVNPAVNPGGRSVQVKVRTTSGAEHLRDGAFVTCWLIAEEKTHAILAPYRSIVYRENVPYVFVVDRATNTVSQRQVQTGLEGLHEAEVLAGVAEDEELVTDGRYRLVEGAPVRIVGIDEEPDASEAPPKHETPSAQEGDL